MNQLDLRPMAHPYDDLLNRAAALFHADERVRALWVHGAIARGVQDAGSDLDIAIAVRDADFDAFTAESALWFSKITPTVSRRELAQMPGSFFALTPTCERIDIITERVSALSTSPLRRRIMVFDRDGLTALVPAPDDPPPQLHVLQYCIEEILRQAANFPVVLIRHDWLLGVVAVQQIHLLLYELFTEANKPLPPTGPKQWSFKLTAEQRQALEHLPVPQADCASIIAARHAALQLFDAQAVGIAQRNGVTWPRELADAVHSYMQRAEHELGISALDW
jgi:predicted nucleotidyltransferase